MCFLLFIAAHAKAQLPGIENNRLVPDNPVTFKPGSNELTDEGKGALKQVKDFFDHVTKIGIVLLKYSA